MPAEGRRVSSQQFRRALGRFTTGVTIVSCVDADAGYIGLTVNSFGALSLEPPLVLWSLRKTSASLGAFTRANRFAVNVLAESQLGLSRRFAASAGSRFDVGHWTTGEHGAPVLADCAAVFECETVSQQQLGDHCLFVGQVLACSETAQAPLLYHAGHYRQLGDLL
jgi:3-hydroxy-9,10-secoandrosta-1,3,5(10)-triene-9,17-dione monooxygenase reductase component